MTRHVPGLEQTVSGKQPLVDGFYLVRVDRIASATIPDVLTFGFTSVYWSRSSSREEISRVGYSATTRRCGSSPGFCAISDTTRNGSTSPRSMSAP
jgi:hypothetical protein